MRTELFERFHDVFNVDLPQAALEQLQLLFFDSDDANWSPSNVTYYFPNGPFECPFYRGFFYIPGYSRCVINRNGEVITVRSGKFKLWSKMKPIPEKGITGGYRVGRAVNDFGLPAGFSRHRALCLTFKHPGVHPKKLFVNHIDGVPGHDSLDNLEMVTPGQNVMHAYDNGLMDKKLVPIDAHNWVTGKEYHFPSVADATRVLGLPHTLIHGRLKAGTDRRFAGGWRFKRPGEVWKEITKEAFESDVWVEILARDIYTGTVYSYPNMGAAARATGVVKGAVQSQIEGEPETPVRGWNFRRKEGFTGWPSYTEKHLAIFRARPTSPGDGVEVLDCETNEMFFFTSPKEAGEHFNLSPITVDKLARYNMTRLGRWKFKLFKVRTKSPGPSPS